MVPQRRTRDGFEEHFGLNYLGHFLLTNLLLDTMKESGSPGRCARVLTVSSATHYIAELDMEDLQGRWVLAGGRPGAQGCPSTVRNHQCRLRSVIRINPNPNPNPNPMPTFCRVLHA